MKEFPAYDKPVLIQALICFWDITGFAQSAKTLGDSVEVLQLLQEIAVITNQVISAAKGYIVKYIGDAALVIFPDELVDEGVQALITLKTKIEAFMSGRGMNNKVTFALHFGEIAIGKLAPFNTLDLAGDAANIAAMLPRGGHYHGRFIMSPQVFRKLLPPTRKMVHKFTPPVVYMLE